MFGMSLSRRDNPSIVDPFTRMHEEFDRMITELFNPRGVPALSERLSWSPRVSLEDADKQVVVTAELPGVKEKDLDLTLTKDQLVIRGTKTEEKSGDEKGVTYTERSYGSFSRCISFPCDVQTDKAEATVKDGILTITIPKVEEARETQKKLQVKSA